MKTVCLVAWGLLLSMGAGCAAQGGEGEATEDAVTVAADRVKPGTFKLYDEPQYRTSPTCDPHTELVLGNDGDGAFASMREALSGSCEIYVMPDERTYRLTYIGDECGSHLFKGTTSVAGKKRDIVLMDHRERLCHDLVAAKIVVEETMVAQEQMLGEPQREETFFKFSSDSASETSETR